MTERISTLLTETNFLDLGIVKFASNHPNHVFLIELLNNDNETITILYDENHNFLSVVNTTKRKNNDNDHNEYEIELSEDQKSQIKQLLKDSRNNI